MLRMGVLDNLVNNLNFTETIFYKENSDLQDQYDALLKLNKEYPNNESLLTELLMVKKGLEGEDEISYQLKKAHIGMYVLRDVKLQYEDLTAQIDYVVITPIFIYYIECKNLVGNITVTEKGDFIREVTLNGKKIKKGMYSPLRQVEAQREVMRKIWETKVSNVIRLIASRNFDYYRRVLVVVANPETILDTSKAPEEIKYKVLKADALIRQMQYDLDHRNRDDVLTSKKVMEETAQTYLHLSSQEKIDYYTYYKNKLHLVNKEVLRERLVALRKKRSSEMNIPAYYVFTNEELEKLLELMPKTIEELKTANLLPSIKVKTHGEAIIETINQ